MSLIKGAVVTLSVSLRKGTVYVLRWYTFVCICVYNFVSALYSSSSSMSLLKGAVHGDFVRLSMQRYSVCVMKVYF